MFNIVSDTSSEVENLHIKSCTSVAQVMSLINKEGRLLDPRVKGITQQSLNIIG
jgi:hypothetical protein